MKTNKPSEEVNEPNGTEERGGTAISRRTVLKGMAGAIALAVAPRMAMGSDSSGLSAASTNGLSKSQAKPRRGGDLRVGTIGGSSSDTLDADNAITFPDWVRNYQLYEGLNQIDADGNTVLQLAEEITPSSDHLTWTIRVLNGIEFHNGKTLSAEDVAFTLKRILNPKAPLPGAIALAPVDVSSFKIVDRRTLQLKTHFEYSSLPDNLAAWYIKVVPVGYDPKSPVGTGPFKYQSFTPGQSSVFTRNPHYWQSGVPYLDSVSIIEFADDGARLDALEGGDIDAVDQVPPSSISPLRSQGHLVVSAVHSGAWRPFTMRVDVPPFNDVRVREAMRLVLNRPEMGEVTQSGYYQLGNDLFGLYDTCYDKSLPQRVQDIPRAKSLLRSAGKENLSVTLTTAPIAPQVDQMSLVLQQQASSAGMHVSVNTVSVSSFYGPGYPNYPFAVDTWFYTPYLAQLTQGMLAKAPFNETHWDNPQYNSLYSKAISTFDEAKRCEIVQEMQRIEYDEGGLIVPLFPDDVDAWNARVVGLRSGATGLGLGNYDFRKAWL
jgi:peptide/nickel transport system substrate-binding protein